MVNFLSASASTLSSLVLDQLEMRCLDLNTLLSNLCSLTTLKLLYGPLAWDKITGVHACTLLSASLVKAMHFDPASQSKDTLLVPNLQYLELESRTLGEDLQHVEVLAIIQS